MDTEVGIVGVGTMGSMVMWQLARRGIPSIGFEQFGIGHDRSAAGGDTRIFRTAYKEGSEYVPILNEAYKQWLELENETDGNFLTLTNGIMIGNPESESMKNVIESIEKYNMECEILNYHEAKTRYPQHRLSPQEIMVIDKQAGFLRSQSAIMSAVSLAEEMGAHVYQHTKVDRIEDDTEGVTIFSDGKKYRFRKVIVCAGPWINKIFPEFQKQVEIRRLIGTWFSTSNIEKFSPDQFPVFMRDVDAGSIYGIPSIDKTMIKISLSAREVDKIKDPDNLERNNDFKDFSLISQIIRNCLPDLYSTPVRVNTYMEAYTKDKHPIIGIVPGYHNTYVLGGFSGHGFKMAPAIGKIAADILIDGKSQLSIEQFNPDRFTELNTI